MGEKDMMTKNLEQYNDVFCDIINVLFFNGEDVVKADELEPAGKDSHYKADGKIHSQERDVSKFWKNANITIAFVGIENQIGVDKGMALRVISYDGAEYRNQYKSKNEKYYPVITLVIYFGKDDWTCGKSLHECLEIPEKLREFVSDYKMNFYAVKDMDEEQISKFKSDFRAIAEFFYALNNKTEYHPTNQKLHHAEEVLDMISVFSKDDKFRDEYNSLSDETKGDGVSMCEIYDNIMEKGIEKGIEKGEKKGVLKILIGLVKDGILTLAEAAKRADMTVEEFQMQTGLMA